MYAAGSKVPSLTTLHIDTQRRYKGDLCYTVYSDSQLAMPSNTKSAMRSCLNYMKYGCCIYCYSPCLACYSCRDMGNLKCNRINQKTYKDCINTPSPPGSVCPHAYCPALTRSLLAAPMTHAFAINSILMFHTRPACLASGRDQAHYSYTTIQEQICFLTAGRDQAHCSFTTIQYKNKFLFSVCLAEDATTWLQISLSFRRILDECKGGMETCGG